MKLLRLFILAFAVMLGGGAAFADDLNLGGNYVPVSVDETGGSTPGLTNVGGGPITISYLDGVQLAYVYCVGFFTDVYVPDDYPDTIVTSNGYVNGAFVNNDGAIAWLLDTYAMGSLGTTVDEQALQAAIWTVEYNGQGVNSALPVITGDSTQAYYSQYHADLTALGWNGTTSLNTAAVSTIDWFSPGNSSRTMYQGLVGPDGPVPEPTSVLLFATVLLSALWLNRKKLVGR